MDIKGKITKTTDKIKAACDSCWKTHNKCNGKDPCQRCASLSIHCTYTRIPRKKGIAAGRFAQLEKEANDLRQQLAIQQALTRDLASRLDDNNTALTLLNSSSQCFNVNKSTRRAPMMATPQASMCSLFENYIQIYNFTVQPYLVVPPLNLSSAEYYSEDLPLSSKLLTTAILAQAAQCSGNMNHAEELTNYARTLIGEGYNDRHDDPLFAASLGMMSSYYSNTGDLDRAIYYNELARTRSQILVDRLTDDDRGVMTAIISGTFLRSHLFLMMTNRTRFFYIKTIHYLQSYLERVDFKGKELLSFSLIIMNLFLQMVEFTDITFAIRTLDELQLSIPTTARPMLRDNIEGIISMMRSTLYFFSGNAELAIQYADVATAKISFSDHVRSPLAVNMLGTLAQIYAFYGQTNQLGTAITQLRLYGTCFPIANRYARWLLDPTTENSFPFVSITKQFDEDHFPSPMSVTEQIGDLTIKEEFDHGVSPNDTTNLENLLNEILSEESSSASLISEIDAFQ